MITGHISTDVDWIEEFLLRFVHLGGCDICVGWRNATIVWGLEDFVMFWYLVNKAHM